jgi:GntR family transcriptional regulator/MocR family aminotransferase
MPKPAYDGDLLDLRLDPGAASPLFRQLYLGLRDAIVHEQLAPGMRLPPTRILATRLGVARNTVINAYEQLFAEGYVEGRIGSGTTVSRDLPIDSAPEQPLAAGPAASRPRESPAQRRRRSLSAFASKAASFPPIARSRARGAFEIDAPAMDAFPLETMRRLLTARLRDDFAALLSDTDPAGIAPLRRAIAGYASSERGIRCSAENVVITAGSLHGVDLLMRTVLEPGDRVAVEDPGDPGIRMNLIAAGARLLPLRVDDEGCDVSALIKRKMHARMIHLTPSNQYPLGGTLSMARRLALLRWAADTGAWIVEDDNDSEFRYSSRPLAPLKALDRAGAVLYVGTFSRILLPTFRLGYLILPQELVAPVIAVRSLSDRHPPPIEQALVAEFMTKGHFAIHVRRMRKLYADRQRAMVEALQTMLDSRVSVRAVGAGMHIVLWLPHGADDEAISRQAAAHDLVLRPISEFYNGKPPRPGLLIGHTAIARIALQPSVRLLASIVGKAL